MTPEEINRLCKDTLIDTLGITFEQTTNGMLRARMAVSSTTVQPHGFLHGGATICLAETVASVFSTIEAGPDHGAFGYHVDASLLLPVRSGDVLATAELVHKGRSSYIWDVTVSTEKNETVALVRVTVKTLLQPK
jgi:1,4-dihydroxy-2-naphthoyl-CoA hydrolase